MEEVDRHRAHLGDSDAVIGIGGGKTLDTAKAVAHFAHLPVMIVPTAASSDAPCSRLSVLYTPEGVFDRYLPLPANPNVVLMDTDVIARAPVRFLVSGLGDAFATYYEAAACVQSNAVTMTGGHATMAAFAIHDGMTALEGTHSMLHGEKVAFGTLAQLVLEDHPLEETRRVYGFFRSVGLPTSLEQIGIGQASDEDLLKVGEHACGPDETMGNMPFEVTPTDVAHALRAADQLGKQL